VRSRQARLSPGTAGGTGHAVRRRRAPRHRLGGSYCAYEEFVINGNGNGDRWTVLDRDLRSGGVVKRLPTGASTPPNVGDGFTTDIVVNAAGSVAWITQVTLDPSTYAIHVVDRSGKGWWRPVAISNEPTQPGSGGQRMLALARAVTAPVSSHAHASGPTRHVNGHPSGFGWLGAGVERQLVPRRGP
jgi:hypothetical protein